MEPDRSRGLQNFVVDSVFDAGLQDKLASQDIVKSYALLAERAIRPERYVALLARGETAAKDGIGAAWEELGEMRQSQADAYEQIATMLGRKGIDDDVVALVKEGRADPKLVASIGSQARAGETEFAQWPESVKTDVAELIKVRNAEKKAGLIESLERGR